MANIVSATFEDRRDAERTVEWLRGRGIPEDAISVVSRHGEDARASGAIEGGREPGDAGRDAGTGVATGLGIGAATGALFGLAALMIPGLGPFIAAGPLAGVLGATAGTVAAGAIVGGTSGAIAGALSGWGVGEAEAHHYAGEVERGATYVGVDLDRARTDRQTVTDGFRQFNGRFHEGAAAGMAGATATGREGEVRVPIVEERAEVQREARQAGEVEITKRADVETRHISEPVTRTDVTVEERDVPAGRYADTAGAATLNEGETIRVPVYEEELVVNKVPEVTREAVIRTDTQTEQVEQDVQLRRERVDVNEIDEDVETTDPVTGRRI